MNRTTRQPADATDRKAPAAAGVHYGAGRDLAQVVTTHLFGVCPNNSGSTFLLKSLAACRAAWSLHREGQRALGFAGPVNFRPLAPGEPAPILLWAAAPHWIDRFEDPARYDWPRIRKAWYFQAEARTPEATVFCTKTPQHLLVVDELARHFRNAKFLFMVRNPYAVCEGICRYMEGLPPHEVARWKALFPVRSLPELAAAHVVACLSRQRRNLEAYGDRGVFFTYEAMCAEPERVARAIQALVPEIDDLNLRRRVPVKGTYHEMLTDMNARQIARLGAGRIAALTSLFRKHRDVLDCFGYDLL